jgi:hypothetical protein
MVCPRCNLSNPETVSRCGCGYDFTLGRVPKPDDSSRDKSHPVSLALWILGVGGAGFVAGFVGPVEFLPESNQGPLIGIFVSGPVGGIVGLLLWAVSRGLQIPARAQWWTLLAACAVVSLATLYVIMPGPAPKGDAIDAQVQSCEPAEQALDAAIQTWEERMSRSNWHGIDPNWRNQARQRLLKDQAVLLDLLVLRKTQSQKEGLRGTADEWSRWVGRRRVSRRLFTRDSPASRVQTIRLEADPCSSPLITSTIPRRALGSQARHGIRCRDFSTGGYWSAFRKSIARSESLLKREVESIPIREAHAASGAGLGTVTGNVIEQRHLQPRFGHGARHDDPILDLRRSGFEHALGKGG